MQRLCRPRGGEEPSLRVKPAPELAAAAKARASLPAHGKKRGPSQSSAPMVCSHFAANGKRFLLVPSTATVWRGNWTRFLIECEAHPTLRRHYSHLRLHCQEVKTAQAARGRGGGSRNRDRGKPPIPDPLSVVGTGGASRAPPPTPLRRLLPVACSLVPAGKADKQGLSLQACGVSF